MKLALSNWSKCFLYYSLSCFSVTIFTKDLTFATDGFPEISAYPVTVDNVVCNGTEYNINDCTADKSLYVAFDTGSLAYVNCTGTVW